MKRVSDPNYSTFEEECFDAGWDSVVNGPNKTNCHFRFFGTPAKTAAWERGAAAAREKRAESPYKKGNKISALEKYRNDAPEEEEDRIEALEAVIAEFDDLIANSDGVDGLRDNDGNFASWQWLKTREGGWLEKYAALKRSESHTRCAE